MAKTNVREKKSDGGRPGGRDRLLTVAVGASAGGLKAFNTFLEALGDSPGVAVVYVTHHRDDGGDRLRDLVAKHTAMEVHLIQDGTSLEGNAVYIGPPGSDVSLFHGRFRLVPPTERGQQAHIDSIFRSLATDQEHYSVGVLLSGAGDDGAEGMRAIHAVSGLTLVQNPATAEYDTMPQSAVAAGVVDKVGEPEELAEAILEYARLTAQRWPISREPSADEEEQILGILSVVQSRQGHDFSPYKRSTIYRRVVRRMGLHRIDSLSSYLQYVRSRPREADALFKDLLIGVTSFFREADAFEALKRSAFPAIFDAANGAEYRFWNPGCATGEEAYTLAILAEEYRREHDLSCTIQIFATDVNEDAVETARRGVYPRSIRRDVSEPRLSEFFEETEDGYRVRQGIRDMVVFARQDLLRDPPFANIDLISCRNLLIYLEPGTQQRLLPVFGYSLKHRGILFVGSAENVGTRTELFTTIDQTHKIFSRNPDVPTGNLGTGPFGSLHLRDGPRRLPEGIEEQTIKRQIEVYLLTNHTPPAVFVNHKGEVIYIHGKTGRFLEPQPGYARMDVTEMAREGLSLHLSHALREARRLGTKQERSAVSIDLDESRVTFDLIVEPVAQEIAGHELFALLFLEREQPQPATETDGALDGQAAAYVRSLEEELRATKERLHTTVEELETTNEELKSSLEEYQSTNEELTSANQELQSAKRTAQEANQALEATSRDLTERNRVLETARDEVIHLLEALDIPIILVDEQRAVRRFTPAAQRIVSLIEGDIGRDLRQITTVLPKESLEAGLAEVFRNHHRIEEVVTTEAGESYLMRIAPHDHPDGTQGALISVLPRALASDYVE